MTNWDLKEGQYDVTKNSKGDILKAIRNIFSNGVRHTSDYKYAFFKALLKSVRENKELRVSFNDIYKYFSGIYFEKVKIYHELFKDIESGYKVSSIDRIMEPYVGMGKLGKISAYLQEDIYKEVGQIVGKYVIGAFFGDAEKSFYSFSKSEQLITFNPVAVEVLVQHAEELEQAINYRWMKYIEKDLEIEQVDSWTYPHGTSELVGRKRVDKSIIEVGETGIPRDFCTHFDIIKDIEEEWEEGIRTSRSVVLIYGEVAYEADIAKRTIGTVVLRVKDKQLKEIFNRVFRRSYMYIKENQVEGRKLSIIVPDSQAEFVEFYKTNQENVFEIKLLTDGLSFLESNEGDFMENNDRNSIGLIQGVIDSEIVDYIAHIHHYIEQKCFNYSLQSIANLYLSLKTKPFTILSGISGTGKSKVIELFAEALGATPENKRYQLIAVRPDWSDSTDLLGYRDLNNQFNVGVLTEIIERAMKDPEVPYFVCLDEMNLARVEYYFSDFLSVIESRKWQEDLVVTHPILQRGALGDDEEAIARYERLYIPDNLYIVGTVNMDETTYPFSKKVLDRANTIEFSEIDLWEDFLDEGKEAREPINISNTFLKSEYLTLRECVAYKDIAQSVIKDLIELNKILEQAQLHFAYRVRDEIIFYMIYNERFNLLRREEAFELQLLQKVLPRISGNTTRVRDVLEQLLYFTKKHIGEGKAYDKIQFMIERYDQDGFTSYWM